MEDIVKKIEINCDMGEGFGRWKMVLTPQCLDSA
jgi:lactam utilization protein B